MSTRWSGRVAWSGGVSRQRWAGDVAAQLLERLAVIGSATHRRVKAETLIVGTQRLGERGVSRHGSLHPITPSGRHAGRRQRGKFVFGGGLAAVLAMALHRMLIGVPAVAWGR